MKKIVTADWAAPNPLTPQNLALCKAREQVISKWIVPTLKKLGWTPDYLYMQSWQNDHGVDPFLSEKGQFNSTPKIKRKSFQSSVKTRDSNLNPCVDVISFSNKEIPLEFRQHILKHPAAAIMNASPAEVEEGVCKGHFIAAFDVSKCWIRLPFESWEAVCKSFK